MNAVYSTAILNLIGIIGHAGTYAAKYTARHLKIAVESSDEWMAYKSSKHKSSDVELLGKALLQAFLQLDDEMLEMTKAGLMVRNQFRRVFVQYVNSLI